MEQQAIPGFLKIAEEKWKLRVPDEPFPISFCRSNFGEMLQKESILGSNFILLTLCVIHFMPGLYGLSAYTAEQRTKEIGIRKVMGASASSIVVMLKPEIHTVGHDRSLISIPLATGSFTNGWKDLPTA